jgi:thiosulfate reductase cytochrome b subunit
MKLNDLINKVEETRKKRIMQRFNLDALEIDVKKNSENYEDEYDVDGRINNDGEYLPNKVSRNKRILYILISFLLFLYGIGGLYKNDLAFLIGGKRGATIYHFHDSSLIILFLAIIFIVMSLVSRIIDHYDTRNNESKYKFFFNTTQIIGIILYVLAIIVYTVNKY